MRNTSRQWPGSFFFIFLRKRLGILSQEDGGEQKRWCLNFALALNKWRNSDELLLSWASTRAFFLFIFLDLFVCCQESMALLTLGPCQVRPCLRRGEIPLSTTTTTFFFFVKSLRSLLFSLFFLPALRCWTSVGGPIKKKKKKRGQRSVVSP